MTIEDFIAPDEAVIWEDRPAGPGTRRVPPGMLKLIQDSALPAIGFGFAGLGAGGYAIFGNDLSLQVLAALFAISLLAFGLAAAIDGVRDRRARARAEPHYVLTARRLVIWDAAEDSRVQILPGTLDAMARKGRNLELYIRRADDAVILYDLADIDAAERALSAVLSPEASSGAPAD
jgi:hypothetical protein